MIRLRIQVTAAPGQPIGVSLLPQPTPPVSSEEVAYLAALKAYLKTLPAAGAKR
jgi:hypothetical protein